VFATDSGEEGSDSARIDQTQKRVVVLARMGQVRKG
jgi:hypothetical protein